MIRVSSGLHMVNSEKTVCSVSVSIKLLIVEIKSTLENLMFIAHVVNPREA